MTTRVGVQGRLIHDIVITKLAGYTREAKYRAVGMLRQLSESFTVLLLSIACLHVAEHVYS